MIVADTGRLFWIAIPGRLIPSLWTVSRTPLRLYCHGSEGRRVRTSGRASVSTWSQGQGSEGGDEPRLEFQLPSFAAFPRAVPWADLSCPFRAKTATSKCRTEDLHAAAQASIAPSQPSARLEESIWLCPIEDRSRLDSTRRAEAPAGGLPGNPLPSFHERQIVQGITGHDRNTAFPARRPPGTSRRTRVRWPRNGRTWARATSAGA